MTSGVRHQRFASCCAASLQLTRRWERRGIFMRDLLREDKPVPSIRLFLQIKLAGPTAAACCFLLCSRPSVVPPHTMHWHLFQRQAAAVARSWTRHATDRQEPRLVWRAIETANGIRGAAASAAE